MPCINLFDRCDGKGIKLKFAWLPTTDLNGKYFWLERYWEYGERIEIGFFALRGRKKYYKNEQDFWDYIKYRVTAVY